MIGLDSALAARASLLALLCLHLAPAWALEVALGKALFQRPWVSAPASTAAADGLGPLYNARSCATCHRQGGRGRVGQSASGIVESPALVPRLSGDPRYGRQIQTRALPGQRPEARLRVDYAPLPVTLGDGQVAQLRRPTYALVDLALGPLDSGTRLSPRLAPALYGLGGVARLPDRVIVAQADPGDRDGDGISGRVSWVWRNGQRVVGRFGWRASLASLEEQTAEALLLDLGLSSPARPHPAGDCTEAQAACLMAPHGRSAHLDGEEISTAMLDLITRYVAALPAPPTPTEAATGAALFAEIGCAACHRPRLSGGGVEIQPYSDFLLHDLGTALGDGEWRTAPLWGLGGWLAEGALLLHDGRARNASEAILWHGGEATASRERFRTLPAEARRALLDFLQTL